MVKRQGQDLQVRTGQTPVDTNKYKRPHHIPITPVMPVQASPKGRRGKQT